MAVRSTAGRGGVAAQPATQPAVRTAMRPQGPRLPHPLQGAAAPPHVAGVGHADQARVTFAGGDVEPLVGKRGAALDEGAAELQQRVAQPRDGRRPRRAAPGSRPCRARGRAAAPATASRSRHAAAAKSAAGARALGTVDAAIVAGQPSRLSARRSSSWRRKRAIGARAGGAGAVYRSLSWMAIASAAVVPLAAVDDQIAAQQLTVDRGARRAPAARRDR